MKAAGAGALATVLLLAGGGYLVRGRIQEAWWISRLDSESVAAVEAAAANLVEARSWRAIPGIVEQLERLHATAGGVSQGSETDLKCRALSNALVRLGPEAVAAWLRSTAPHPSPWDWKEAELERTQLLESLLTCTRHADGRVRGEALDCLKGGILEAESIFLAFAGALSDADQDVRKDAIHALTTCRFSLELAWEALVSMLEAPAAKHRNFALQQICLFDGHEREKVALLMGRKLSNQDLAGIGHQVLRLGLDESALSKLAHVEGSLKVFERLRDDPDADVQDVAFEGLEIILEADEAAQVNATPWVDVLLARIAARGDWFERHLRVLGHLGRRDARVLPVLLSLLAAASNEVRAAAASGAGALGAAGKPAIPRLLALLSERPGDEAVYVAAAQALGRMGTVAVEAVPALLKLALDKSLKEEEGDRDFVLFSLPWLAKGSPEAEAALVELLLALLADPEDAETLSQGIHNALRVLGPRAKGAAGLLWKLCESSPADDRWPFVFTLLAVEPDTSRALRELLSLATAELSLDKAHALGARLGAPRALRQLGPIARQGIPFLEMLLGGEYATWDGFHTLAKLQPESPFLPRALRRLAVEGDFTAIPDRQEWKELGPSIVPCLLAVLDDADARVRLRSLQILRRMGDKAVPAIPGLERCLADPVDVVRRQAAATLQEIHSAR